MRSGVFLAPITPATCATDKTSPLAIVPRRIFSRVSGWRMILARAVAARSVELLALTSTIRARPDSLKCVNSAILRAESARCRKKRNGIIGAGGKGSQGRKNEGSRFGLLCSRNARSEKALVGRAQWETKQPTLYKEKKQAWREGI